MQFALKLCVISLTFQLSDARPSFVSRIPNGDGVSGVSALGHVNSGGGGATNAFGEAFEAAGTEWTKELCEADSDGDGATNGEELGDPCCTWTASTGFDSSSTSQSPSHPGVANSFTTDQLSAMTCGGEADLNSVASSGAASSSSTSSSSASGLQSTSSSSSGSAFADVVAPEDEPRFSPGPKLDPTPQSPATSNVNKLQSDVAAIVYCFSAAILLAL